MRRYVCRRAGLTTNTRKALPEPLQTPALLEMNGTPLELSLPPVKIHCSVLAEDAIKAAVQNYRDKQDG